MSYGFTVYTDREAIKTTKVYSETSQSTYLYNYGTGQRTLNGFSDGSYLTFTAIPADGYEFYRWVYHIGSPTSTAQYVYANEDEDDPSTFRYYGSTGNDIYIAAEGKQIGSDEPDEPDEPEQSKWQGSYSASGSYITDETTFEEHLSTNQFFVRKMSFRTSGTATFYTSCDSGDTV